MNHISYRPDAAPPTMMRHLKNLNQRMKLLALLSLMLLPLGTAGLAASPSPALTNEVAALRNAIQHLVATCGERYPRGAGFLAQLKEIEQRPTFSREEFEKLRREALLSNPLVSDQPLLFVVRAQYVSDHHNTETMFQTGEINTGSFRGPEIGRAHV